ncbi:hypothetical protein BG011_002029 [Mortierella polycephala]|uniref:Uncharacterized protein n=1 Tax=Mortierella polycephala TaxID=41804 RepID=A0A9P6UAH3_9FUNG|nr:hypothetical protein BG011_002029 [Mortierella polycephala]
MAPSGSVAQAPGPGPGPENPSETTASASPTRPTIPTATATATATTSTAPTVPTIPPVITTSTVAPPLNTTTTVPPPPATSSIQPTTSAAPPPPATVTCMSTSQCAVNQICALQSNVAATGVCQTMVKNLCLPNPVVKCQTNADCNDPAFSYCYTDGKTNEKSCAGLGRPGTNTECNSENNPTNPPDNKGSNDTVTTTLKYAGIGVGSVALLGILFALVRWQRNKSRSKVPEFAEIDYGMSARHRSRRSEPRSSIGGVTTGAAAGAGAVAATEQSYPFSSRPHAGGTPGQDGYYDDQYYDGQYAQNMHPMAGMAGGNALKEQQYYGHYDDGYDQQAYDQQAYDQQYYKEAAAYNGGYDQHGNYVGDGVYYDNGNYNYGDQQQQQQPYVNPAIPATSGADYVTSPTVPTVAHTAQTRQGFGEHGNGNYPANI